MCRRRPPGVSRGSSTARAAELLPVRHGTGGETVFPRQRDQGLRAVVEVLAEHLVLLALGAVEGEVEPAARREHPPDVGQALLSRAARTGWRGTRPGRRRAYETRCPRAARLTVRFLAGTGFLLDGLGGPAGGRAGRRADLRAHGAYGTAVIRSAVARGPRLSPRRGRGGPLSPCGSRPADAPGGAGAGRPPARGPYEPSRTGSAASARRRPAVPYGTPHQPAVDTLRSRAAVPTRGAGARGRLPPASARAVGACGTVPGAARNPQDSE